VAGARHHAFPQNARPCGWHGNRRAHLPVSRHPPRQPHGQRASAVRRPCLVPGSCCCAARHGVPAISLAHAADIAAALLRVHCRWCKVAATTAGALAACSLPTCTTQPTWMRVPLTSPAGRLRITTCRRRPKATPTVSAMLPCKSDTASAQQ